MLPYCVAESEVKFHSGSSCRTPQRKGEGPEGKMSRDDASSRPVRQGPGRLRIREDAVIRRNPCNKFNNTAEECTDSLHQKRRPCVWRCEDGVFIHTPQMEFAEIVTGLQPSASVSAMNSWQRRRRQGESTFQADLIRSRQVTGDAQRSIH